MLKITFILTVIITTSCLTTKNTINKNQDEIWIEVIENYSESPYPNERKNLLKNELDSTKMKKLHYIDFDDKKKFQSYLSSESSFNENASICWRPEIGIYFINKGIIVNYIEISLECNRLMSALKMKKNQSIKIGKIYQHKGLSIEFRSYIKFLMTKYGKIDLPYNPRYD